MDYERGEHEANINRNGEGFYLCVCGPAFMGRVGVDITGNVQQLKERGKDYEENTVFSGGTDPDIKRRNHGGRLSEKPSGRYQNQAYAKH